VLYKIDINKLVIYD